MHVDLNWPMRSVRLAVVLTAALGVMQGTVRAQDYPSQDIRLICGFPPGSGADVFVRHILPTSCARSPAAPWSSRTRSGRRATLRLNMSPARSRTATRSTRLRARRWLRACICSIIPPVDVGKAIRVAATTSNLAFMLVVDAKSPHKSVAEFGTGVRPWNRRAVGPAMPLQPIPAASWARSQGHRRSRGARGAIPNRRRFPARRRAASSTTACTT